MSETARHYHLFETAMGFCAIAWSESGVARFQLPTKSAEAAERLIRRRAFGAEPGTPPEDVAAVVAAAKRYFAGEEIDFSNVRLDLAGQDAFFAQIYTALREVGWGRTTTYGALAKEVGAGREAARDVGEAMAKNPAPLIIPCHRVLAAGGKIGGFSAPAGSSATIFRFLSGAFRLGSKPRAPDRGRGSDRRRSRGRSTGVRRHRRPPPRRAGHR
jgi:methylated-DNA-[protein]-cysteine S-methyltransferase